VLVNGHGDGYLVVYVVVIVYRKNIRNKIEIKSEFNTYDSGWNDGQSRSRA
jgi:hypothetical protein